MSRTNAPLDVWALPAYLLWLVFFLAGFDPQLTYTLAREAGLVVSQTALVNSPHLVTLALAGYLGVFAYQRCRDVGMEDPDAKARGVQFAILGLIAFLEFSPFELLRLAEFPGMQNRLIVMFVLGAKLFTWLLLLAVVARYYLLGHVHVFANMVSAFPSTYRSDGSDEIGTKSSVAWLDSRPPAENPPIPQPGQERERF